MKGKKIFGFVISLIMLILICCSPFISSAYVYYMDGNVITCPGHVKNYTKAEDYNYAWLDEVVVRDGSYSVTALTLYPKTDYPYSHTYDTFARECNDYADLFAVSENIIEQSFIDVAKNIYYSLIATGIINEELQKMQTYNESQGIVYPYVESKYTDMYTALVYVCLKNDLCKAVFDQYIQIPRGTTLEGAVVLMLSKFCGMELPASVDTLSAFSYRFANEYVLENNRYPVSDNPTEEEVYFWVKVQAAEKSGYEVPIKEFKKLSADEKEYVTYAYYASILTTKYSVIVDPIELRSVLLSSSTETELPKLVLKSMLDSVSVGYGSSESGESLFKKALKEGFFNLKDEFYTDIFDYDIVVEPTCEKVWITSFLIAEQLENGSVNNAKTYINDILVNNNSTNAVELNASGNTKFTVKVVYDSSDKHDSAVYNFTVTKSDYAAEANGFSVNLAEPLESIASSAFGAVNNVLPNDKNTYEPGTGYVSPNTFTTYDVGGNTTYPTGQQEIIPTYPVDENGNVLTTKDALQIDTAEETTVSILSGVGQAIRENPAAAVATPIGILTVGASAGYIFFRKRKDESALLEDNDMIDESEDISID